MKIVIISDLHGNFDALEALPETYTELWVLGDLVNFGPEPAAVVDFVKANCSIVVRGNHDHSIGYAEDPHCSPRFRKMADVTRRYTASVLNQDQKQFFEGLASSQGVATAKHAILSLPRKTIRSPLRVLPGRFSRLDRRSPGGIRGCPAGWPYPCALYASHRQLLDRQSWQPWPTEDWQAGRLLRSVGRRLVSFEVISVSSGKDRREASGAFSAAGGGT